MKNKKGFTLIEMLIVVTILGILAAVVLPRFTNSTGNATKKSHATERTFINTQIGLLAANENLDSSIVKLDTAATTSATAPGFGVLGGWPQYFGNDVAVNGTTAEDTWKCNQTTLWTTSGGSITSHSGHE